MKLKNIKSISTTYLVMSILLLIIPSNLNAQSCHGGGGDHSSHGGGGNHSSHNKTDMGMSMSPHGGVVKPAGKYFIEMVKNANLKKDNIAFYILNNEGEVVSNKGIASNLTIINKAGEIINGSLSQSLDDGFIMDPTDIVATNLSVSFKIKKKSINSTFQLGADNSQLLAQDYSCSMHPEITSTEPGNCPKCGMRLTLQQ